MAQIVIVPFDHNHKPNTDGDVRSLVRRLIDIEEKIEAQNKLKSIVFAEARASNVDVAALKAVVRTHQYLPESHQAGLSGLAETVKRYLDIVNNVSAAHTTSEN